MRKRCYAAEIRSLELTGSVCTKRREAKRYERTCKTRSTQKSRYRSKITEEEIEQNVLVIFSKTSYASEVLGSVLSHTHRVFRLCFSEPTRFSSRESPFRIHLRDIGVRRPVVLLHKLGTSIPPHYQCFRIKVWERACNCVIAPQSLREGTPWALSFSGHVNGLDRNGERTATSRENLNGSPTRESGRIGARNGNRIANRETTGLCQRHVQETLFLDSVLIHSKL